MKDFFETVTEDKSKDYVYGALLQECAMAHVGVDKESYMRFLLTATFNNNFVSSSGSKDMVDGWNAYSRHNVQALNSITYKALSLTQEDKELSYEA